ncbi:hypothetical protein B0J17DRAFT_56655 [Rhizoctonia solani]|nr:hypothetical protein B0J17DRAFT_56655 [Rhizoctonia solani]
MFDPTLNMELSQHLFDIQMAKYTQRARQSPDRHIPHSSAATTQRTSDAVKEEQVTNNLGTGGGIYISRDHPTQIIPGIDIRDSIEHSNRLAEQANQLAERSNLLIERSNRIAERANEMTERLNYPAQHTNNLLERLTDLFGRVDEHFERSYRLAELSIKPIEKLEEVLKKINKVLVGIQHAIVRNRKGNTHNAADCLVNESGEVLGQSAATSYATFEGYQTGLLVARIANSP